MELSKTGILELIHKRLATVSKSLAELDAAYAKKDTLGAELVKLKGTEANLIAKDDTSPDALVSHRAKTDLLAGKLARAHQSVLAAAETAVLDAETASVNQYKQAAIAAYFDRVGQSTAEFFDKQDRGMLKALAHRSPTGIQLVNADELMFNPRTPSLRAHDIGEARRMRFVV